MAVRTVVGVVQILIILNVHRRREIGVDGCVDGERRVA